VTGRILFEPDLDTSILKTRQIGLIGYGSQGRAQALNLRDSGFAPLIGLRPGPSFETASRDGFAPASPQEVSSASDIIMLLTPDETHAEICDRIVTPSARDGTHIGFSAGFSVHYGVCRIRKGLRPILAAPKGPGSVLREKYKQGMGIPALVAARDGDAEGLEIAKAYATALGCARAGVVVTTFREEAIADLFGEQSVLCGGLVELMKGAFGVLVDRGYAPEVAYIECVSEVEYMASLIARVGLADLEKHISSTAFYGGVTRGRRVIDRGTRKRLESVLDEIESGRFYEEFRRSVELAGSRRPGSGDLERMERARTAFRTESEDAR